MTCPDVACHDLTHPCASGRSILEYVPAEYFRGESSLAGPPITSVYCASRCMAASKQAEITAPA
jgi:hypothetical protein